MTCTDFCEKLRNLELKDGGLPSHEELTNHLDLATEERDHGFLLGTYADLAVRRGCPFCQLVVTAVNDNLETCICKPQQALRVVLFRGEQSFRLSYPSRLGTRLAFVADAVQLASGPDNARLVSSCDQKSLVQTWLESCVRCHSACELEQIRPNRTGRARSYHFNEGATSNFRLVDLKRGCVVHAALDETYVALSYVWGDLPMLMLKTANFDDLSMEGCLDSIRSELPRTINEAIDFVKSIGQRYLWIDSLCLVQDDHDDVTLGIQMMNSIYHGSHCTIVAASGADANAGLTGGEQPMQKSREIAPGLKMAVLHSIDWRLKRSLHNTRGWTLQELVLSRRTIIFIDGQVDLRCREANWSQDSWAETREKWLDPDDSNITRIPGLLDGWIAHVWPYQKLLEDYSRRSLRRDGDAIRATAGIIRTLAAGMRTGLVEGLPGYWLDHFLLFISSDGNMQRRAQFGSFSWAGWRGKIMWPRENFAWYDDSKRTWEVNNILKYSKHNRLIQWGMVDRHGYLEHLSSSAYRWRDIGKETTLSPLQLLLQEHPSLFQDFDRDPYGHYDRRWYSSSGSHGDMPYWGSEYEPTIQTSLRGPHGNSRFSIKALDLMNGQAEFERMVQSIEDNAEKRALMNWNAMRHWRVRQAEERRSHFGPKVLEEFNSSQFKFRDIPDESHVLCDQRRELGEQAMDKEQVPKFPPYDVLVFKTVSLSLSLGTKGEQRSRSSSPFDGVPGIPLYDNTKRLVGSLHPDNFNLLGEEGCTVELLIVTRCFEPTVGSALLGIDSAGPLPRKMFWVLHIVWIDGIAERRGVGQILEQALYGTVSGKPEVKDILLG